jgi:3-hydroxyisobutyrate dehydrogenase-like beta-hydroxyacid dehydrogenase
MRIAYLGVGNMGQPMAGKLLDAGHELWVYDVRAEAMRPLVERQARPAASPRELAETCETVVVSLPTLEVFRAVLNGPEGLFAGKALKTLVNTCTVGVPFTREIEQACAAAGVILIDAPISGGPAGARAGTLAIMVAGDAAKVAELMPVLRLWGPTVVVAGEKPGAAQVMKLTNNIVFVAALIATSEAMTMATKAGISAEAMLQILNNGTGRNFATTTMFPNAVLPALSISGPRWMFSRRTSTWRSSKARRSASPYGCARPRGSSSNTACFKAARGMTCRGSYRSSRTARGRGDPNQR